MRLDAEAGERADHALARALEQAGRPSGRRDARRLLESGVVTIDGRRVDRSSAPLSAGRHVFVVRADEAALPTPAESRRRLALTDADVLELTEERVVVAKPPGIPTDPTRDPRRDSMVDAVARYLAARGDAAEGLRAAHRLDRDTSGVLLIARTRAAAATLGDAFRDRRATKVYLALTVPGPGAVPWPVGETRVVDAPLGELPGGGPTRYGVTRDGKPARTVFECLAAGDRASLFRAMPETGRTHQVRLHLAHVGYPIAGDTTYGAGDPPAPRVMLHAAELRIDGATWRAAPPADFREWAAAYVGVAV